MIKKAVLKRIPIVKYKKPVQQIRIDAKEMEKINFSIQEKIRQNAERRKMGSEMAEKFWAK